MIGIIKAILYMIFALVIAQIVSFFYNFIIFYLKKNKKSSDNVGSEVSVSMLQCDKCKVYISKSEAYIIDGKVYCKKEHAD